MVTSFLVARGRPCEVRRATGGMVRMKSFEEDPGPSPSGGEEALLRRLKEGAEESRAELAERYARPLLRTARRLVGDEEARDCVQEALMSAIANIAQFEGRSSLETWLRRIVINAALQRVRKAARRGEELVEDPYSTFDASGCRVVADVGEAPSVDELLGRKRVLESVRGAIAELSPTHRAVIVLHHMEDYSIDDVAELLEISPGAVKMRLHRARQTLAAVLEPALREDLP